jgi:hypothetical protein
MLKGLKLEILVERNEIVKNVKPEPNSEVMCMMYFLKPEEMI